MVAFLQWNNIFSNPNQTDFALADYKELSTGHLVETGDAFGSSKKATFLLSCSCECVKKERPCSLTKKAAQHKTYVMVMLRIGTRIQVTCHNKHSQLSFAPSNQNSYLNSGFCVHHCHSPADAVFLFVALPHGFAHSLYVLYSLFVYPSPLRFPVRTICLVRVTGV